MACHDDINQLPLYFCVLCGETFLTNGEFAIHTTDYEDSQYPCASWDEYFRTSTYLTDHVYTDHENNLDMTIPEDAEGGEQSFVTDLDLQNHLKGHETIITWICSVCDEKFQTREEVGDHQRHLHDDSFEKLFSFLARNMGDVFEVSSTVNDHEIP